MAGRRTVFARPRGAAGIAILGSSAAALLLGWSLGYAFPHALHSAALGPVAVAASMLAGALIGVLAVLAYQRSVGQELAESRAALEESEARLELATAIGGVGVWEWDLATDQMFYSPEARQICGFSPDEPVTLDDARSVTHPMDYPITWAQARRALDPAVRGREPYDYRVVRRSDGAVRWVLAQGEAEFDGDGPNARPVRYIGTLLDVTERRTAEQALIESERRLRLALGAGRLAVWELDLDGRGESNPELNALFGFPEDARPTLEDFNAAYLPGEQEKVQAAFAQSFQREDRFAEVEAQIRRPNGDVRWLNLRAELLEGTGGVPYRLIGVAADVTERKAAEERMLLLAREVDHRANNLLSVVQSTVALSKAPTARELRTVIEGRVHALAAAHRLLTASRWEGTDLETLIRDELLAFSMGRAEQVHVEGPALKLSPAAAQALAMVLHELTTNACKYGSLCSPDGRVDVTWTVTEGGVLTIDWQESGGPPVEPPSGQGFGSSLIERALGGALGGEARIDWRPEGVHCHMVLPLGRADAPSEEESQAAEVAG